MDDTRRRRVLQLGGATLLSGLAGCSSILGSVGDDESGIQDTDGDGVIDSEDYAPRDPEVQREEQVKGDEPTETPPEPTDEERVEGDDSTDTPTESTDEIVAQNQLISRWPLEDDLEDVMGDNDASAARGDAAFGSYAGRRALRFDGDLGVMINRGENSELSILEADGAGASVGGWIYFDAAAGGNPRGDNTRHHILRNDNEYNFVAVPSGDLESFQFRFAGVSESSNGELTVPSEEWHHFCYTIEPGSSTQFYLDAEQVFEADIDLTNPTETAYWSHETIGSWYGTTDPTWYDLLVGKMADLRVYDVRLTRSEIAQMYQNTR